MGKLRDGHHTGVCVSQLFAFKLLKLILLLVFKVGKTAPDGFDVGVHFPVNNFTVVLLFLLQAERGLMEEQRPTAEQASK